ncbi:cuticle protein 7-like [Penaeus indicus]|uniref:cuticle protein 7-like n=1 Tax=Penaeus indicus TaxID=29960 RepID=UPI00300C8812
MFSVQVPALLVMVAAAMAKPAQLGHGHGINVHHVGSHHHGVDVHHGPPIYTPDSHHGGVAHHTVEVHHEAAVVPVPVVKPVPVVHPVPVPVHPSAPAHYSFNYGVQDDYKGTNFGHAESRDGYKTEGVYYVHLPDGRLQTVKYYADEHGFHPEVSYKGVAHHDTGLVHH